MLVGFGFRGDVALKFHTFHLFTDSQTARLPDIEQPDGRA